mmetsp:Transcript_25784/g.30389  ORF Transcript_25784/g.30389 Transcript_25784/m.30389 type:complete len:113 (-) Transcript_25784:221-559(-)
MTHIDDSARDYALYRKSEGYSRFANNDYTRAIECYTDAIQINPLDVTFYYNHSSVYHMAVTNYSEVLCDMTSGRERSERTDPRDFTALPSLNLRWNDLLMLRKRLGVDIATG